MFRNAIVDALSLARLWPRDAAMQREKATMERPPPGSRPGESSRESGTWMSARECADGGLTPGLATLVPELPLALSGRLLGSRYHSVPRAPPPATAHHLLSPRHLLGARSSVAADWPARRLPRFQGHPTTRAPSTIRREKVGHSVIHCLVHRLNSGLSRVGSRSFLWQWAAAGSGWAVSRQRVGSGRQWPAGSGRINWRW